MDISIFHSGVFFFKEEATGLKFLQLIFNFIEDSEFISKGSMLYLSDSKSY